MTKILLALLLSISFRVQAQPALINEQAVTTQVSEVQELVYIIYAISKNGLNDSLRIYQKSEYYSKVIQKFYHYKESIFVNKFGKYVEKNYNTVVMDACNYYFDKDGNIVKKEGVKNLSWGHKDFIKPHLKELEHFAKTTGFSTFFDDNKPYYEKTIKTLVNHTHLEKQKKWLENYSGLKYDNFVVFIAPLNGGWHSTNRFMIGSKRYFAIFVSASHEKDSTDFQKVNEARMVFTEIDHNYVNPISDQKAYFKKIKRSFSDRKRWANDKTIGYKSAYAVFNEYMTWSLFTLYVYDNYPKEIFTATKENVEQFMMNHRGFYRFKAFNNKILERYLNQNNKTILDLYNPILDWCEQLRYE